MSKFYGYDNLKLISSKNVVRARHIETGKIHAIKLIFDPFITENNSRHLYRELKIMRKLA